MTYLLWGFLGIWMLQQAASVFCIYMYWRYVPADGKLAGSGRALLIVPVRGTHGRSLSGFLRSLDEQIYRDWRVVFVVEDDSDPACPALTAYARKHPARAAVVVAGYAADEGQKVHNLRAGLAEIGPDDSYVVFADADGLLPPNFLGRLLFPLERQRCEVVTSYRLIYPADRQWGSLLAAAVNLQVATFARYRLWDVPWGGGTAMTAETCRQLALSERWRGALSDDLWLGRLAREAGLRIRMQRDILVWSPVSMNLAQCLAFGIRQYRHAWLTYRRLWLIGAVFLSSQLLGWGLWLASLGVDAWAALGLGAGAYAAAWARAALRGRIIHRVHGGQGVRRMRRVLGLDMIAPFAIVLAHAAMIATSALSRRIRWAGCVYWVRRGRVERMLRTGSPAPAGAQSSVGADKISNTTERNQR